MLIDLIAGARPNFMKIAPIIDALSTPHSKQIGLQYRLVHTGQHYDELMSKNFFQQLEIPEPGVNLKVGSGTQAEQTAKIMVRYEALLLQEPSDVCLVVGDVTSTMACAIAARKLGIPVAHVEGGIRSGDMEMPEEINRIVTDSITNWFFTTSETANENLRRSGVDPHNIFFVGNTMIDTLLKQMKNFQKPSFWDSLGLIPSEYFVVTLHRPNNVDEGMQLHKTLDCISKSVNQLPVVFPVHPRTRKVLDGFSKPANYLHFVDPLGYLEFNYLVKHAKGVITDSGGVTEETTVMGIPCITLRDSTERPETITVGTNKLIGTDPENLAPVLQNLIDGHWQKGSIPEKWDGNASRRIVEVLSELLG
ncbi:MAG: UDP-N-acetylglucosamine 2-epimerase (non-hydrolyzing) [Pseudomonadota bacterium]